MGRLELVLFSFWLNCNTFCMRARLKSASSVTVVRAKTVLLMSFVGFRC